VLSPHERPQSEVVNTRCRREDEGAIIMSVDGCDIDVAAQRLKLFNEAADLATHRRAMYVLRRTGRLDARAMRESVLDHIMCCAINDVMDLGLSPLIVSCGYGLPIKELALEVAYYEATEAAEISGELHKATMRAGRRRRVWYPFLQARIMADEDDLPGDPADRDEAWNRTCERYRERAARDFPKTRAVEGRRQA